MKRFLQQLNLRHRFKTFLPEIVRRRLCNTEDLDRLERRRNFLQSLLVSVEDQMRALRGKERHSITRRIPRGSQVIPVSVLERTPPWAAERVETRNIPGMVTDEEIQYYLWLGSLYTGLGHAVELGPWLGRSTTFILDGLKRSSHFKGRRLFAYDDFVWRASFMNDYVPSAERLAEGADFLPIFQRYTSDYRDMIHVEACRILLEDRNQHVPPLAWDKGPVEFLFVDCGRTYLGNHAWFDVFRPSFVPGVTVIVMQDWRTHREVPRKPYNHTLQFTEFLDEYLELIHETRKGGIGTFLWRGENS